jgi:hypothetical protein
MRTTLLVAVAVVLTVALMSKKNHSEQFAECQMDAIKNARWTIGDYQSEASEYLYACMRKAGYDLKSHKTGEGYCTAWDRMRIVLPECYQSTNSAGAWISNLKTKIAQIM